MMVICCDVVVEIRQVANLLASKLSNRAKSDKGVGQKVENARECAPCFVSGDGSFRPQKG